MESRNQVDSASSDFIQTQKSPVRKLGLNDWCPECMESRNQVDSASSDFIQTQKSPVRKLGLNDGAPNVWKVGIKSIQPAPNFIQTQKSPAVRLGLNLSIFLATLKNLPIHIFNLQLKNDGAQNVWKVGIKSIQPAPISFRHKKAQFEN